MATRYENLKSLIAILVVFFVAVLPARAFAASVDEEEAIEFTDGDFDYRVLSTEDRTVELIKYSRSPKLEPLHDIVIPEEVYYEEVPYTVVSIGKFVFRYNKDIETVSLPNSLVRIGTSAFSYTSLKDIQLPANLKEIGDHAFMGCLFTSLILPEGIEVLEQLAFCKCEELSEINLPSSLNRIGLGCFSGCKALTSVQIPPSIEVIENTVFSETGLTSVEIPEGIIEIRGFSFSQCYQLESVSIPESVSLIDSNPFPECPLLKTFIIHPGNLCCVAENGILYNKAKNKLISYPTAEGNVVLENNIIEISNAAFDQCNQLRTITLPESIQEIGNQAFYYCNMLDSVKCLALNPPRMGYIVFSDMEDLDVSPSEVASDIRARIYVPAQSLDLYKEAPGWKRYRDMVKPLPEASVGAILEEENNHPLKVYTIDGRELTGVKTQEELDRLPRGIYIIKGKKVIVR